MRGNLPPIQWITQQQDSQQPQSQVNKNKIWEKNLTKSKLEN